MAPAAGHARNPVGIDGVLEALMPPYVKSMDDGGRQFIEEKYGPAGIYGDNSIFAAPTRIPPAPP